MTAPSGGRQYSGTNVSFEGMSLEQIRNPIVSGPGDESMRAAATALGEVADKLDQLGAEMGSIERAYAEAHEGDAAEETKRYLRKLGEPGRVGAVTFAAAGRSLVDQAAYYTTARAELAGLTTAGLASTSRAAAEAGAERRGRAARHAAVYQENTNHNLAVVFEGFSPVNLPAPNAASADPGPAPGWAGPTGTAVGPPQTGVFATGGVPGGSPIPAGGPVAIPPAAAPVTDPASAAGAAIPPGPGGTAAGGGPGRAEAPGMPRTDPAMLPGGAVGGIPAGPGRGAGSTVTGPAGMSPGVATGGVPGTGTGATAGRGTGAGSRAGLPPMPGVPGIGSRGGSPPGIGDGALRAPVPRGVPGSSSWGASSTGESALGRTARPGAPEFGGRGGAGAEHVGPRPLAERTGGAIPHGEEAAARGAQNGARQASSHMPFIPGGAMGGRGGETRPRPDWLVEDDPEGVWLADVPPHGPGVLRARDREV